MKCCKVGPGPWQAKPFDIFYHEAPTYKGYNTRCENWDPKSGNCSIWDSKDLPMECRIFVCQNRTYTKKELSKIKALTEKFEFGTTEIL